MRKGFMIGCSLGNCVHVAGAVHFLELAKEEGYETLYLGPAVSVERLTAAVAEKRPDVVCVGYRLTPENAVPLVRDLMEKSRTLEYSPTWVFGGTRPVAEAVRRLDFFDVVYDGLEDIDDCIDFLRGGSPKVADETAWKDDLAGRIGQKRPYPLLRHHFGLPSYERTLEGIREIAEAKVLDVLSLGPDQNTQQFFFHPERRDPALDGAGGVPIRTEAEFAALKQASRCGNHPLMRCYSGTADVEHMADLLARTISNAWCAVPLCWYGELD
ncbi:MAG TPA: cobalamin-dependent protein, partial [Clostridia bacterium]|nr:cobalamin-dependent protein [Clostridia bacterium]